MTEFLNKQEKDVILVVDDTKLNIDLLMDILGESYDIRVATDGESALEMTAEDPPDLILLDIMMPGIDGYQVCKQLKVLKRTREIPVIFLTALGELSHKSKGLAMGAVDYITKPFNPEIVKLRVENTLKLIRTNAALKKHNDILLENERLRNEVEGIARHDLKTPLNALITIPELLLLEDNIAPSHREMLKMISMAGFRVMDIINSSIDLYKMEKKKYRLRPIAVDLVKIFRQIKGEIFHLMGEKNIALKMTIAGLPAGEDDTFMVYGEQMLFYSMFISLVKNAVEASPVGNCVTVDMNTKGETPIVMINNQGVIPEAIQKTFFDKYVTHGKSDGTGLGTYSARLIAQTLGGRLSFCSVKEDGTTLMLELRDNLKKENEEEAFDLFFDESPLQIKKLAPKRGMQIMVLDDYAIMRGTIIGILRQMGFKNFIRAEDGVEGIRQLQTNSVDLIISDLNMPGVNGLELLKHVKQSKTLKHIPFIMISGGAKPSQVAQAVELGVDGFLIKPFSADTLMKKLAGVID
nr:response regulator [uncultured Desulfobacter sp.]